MAKQLKKFDFKFNEREIHYKLFRPSNGPFSNPGVIDEGTIHVGKLSNRKVKKMIDKEINEHRVKCSGYKWDSGSNTLKIYTKNNTLLNTVMFKFILLAGVLFSVGYILYKFINL